MSTKRSKGQHIAATPNRREFVFHSGMGLGSVALSSLMAGQQKGKQCIFLLMEGGPSHIDTFDPKPKLTELHMTRFQKERNKFEANMNTGERYFVKSPFEFRRAGQLGMEVNSLLENFAGVVDDCCFYRGLQAESVNHPTALYHLNTGNQFGGDPAVGAWVSYGLGTENQNLPSFVVLPDVAYPQGGAANWSSGYLPAQHQGTPLRSAGAPILDMAPPSGVLPAQQKANLSMLRQLEKEHATAHPEHAELTARLESYELAFRMQAEMPGIVDLTKESRAMLEMYGIGAPTKKLMLWGGDAYWPGA